MAKSIAIAIIHGIGQHDEKAPKKSEDNPLDRFKGKMVSKINELMETAEDPIESMSSEIRSKYANWGGKQKLVIKPIHWGKDLQDMENILWGNIKDAEMSLMKVREMIVYFVGDVLAYQPAPGKISAYESIHDKIRVVLKELAAEAGKDAPLVVIAHSLGTVIMSNFINSDLWHLKSKTSLEKGKSLKALYTMGSPLALYSLRYQSYIDKKGNEVPMPFGAPVKVDTWKNFYDKNDLVAYPLSNLNPLFKKCGVEDVVVDVGGLLTKWNAASHVGYWTSPDVIDQIVKDLLKI